MMEENESEYNRFKNLSFEDFKALAKDDSLSMYEKIGFPDSYRKGKEELIFKDILFKLNLNDSQTKKNILDIGPGCSELAHLIIEYCKNHQHQLLLIDHAEMLDQLPLNENIEKYIGYFPDDAENLINRYQNKLDAIICYSIFHYVFYNTCSFKFLDVAVSLLKPGGRLLIADIPNISKRKRFFSTQTGIQYHQEFTQTDSLPKIEHLQLEPAQIDDGVIFGILQRYRNFGFETYLLPQHNDLAMANRREDILICKT